MRKVGSIPEPRQAELFADYLLTTGIPTRIEPEGDAFAVWICDEQQVAEGRRELKAFLSNPEDSRYREASRQAQELRREEEKRQQQVRRNLIDVRRDWKRPTLARCRVTLALMLLSVLLTLWSQFGKNLEVYSWLTIGSFQNGLAAIYQQGQIWRLITPIFVHLDLLHLLFNLYWTYQFGSLIESRRGSGRFVALVLFVAIVSNLAQFFTAGPFFGGMSGVGYGLFGYLWIKGRFDPAAGMQLPQSLVIFFLLWLFLCTTGLFGPVANTAHFVGMFAGIAVAGVPLLLRRQR